MKDDGCPEESSVRVFTCFESSDSCDLFFSHNNHDQ